MPERAPILIVEDSPTQAMHLRYLLESAGYTVTTAADGVEGLETAGAVKPMLIISDVVMPQMNGYEMCRILKNDAHLKHIPLILLTTLSDAADVIEGLHADADFYLTKPFDADYLLSRVADILASPMDESPADTCERLSIVLNGKRHDIVSNSRRILNLLMSTYENAVQRNRELLGAQEALKQANEQLEERIYDLRVSENRFKSLVRTIPDIVYRIDRNGRFNFINDAIGRLGYTPAELIGKHFSAIIYPADAQIVDSRRVLPRCQGRPSGDSGAPKLFDERRAGDRKTAGLEIRLVPRHGGAREPGFIEPISDEFVIVEVNSSGMWQINPRADDKDFLGTVGVIRDISARKKIEKELEESEARLRTIFDYASAGIIVIDPAVHRIVDANPTAVQMIGGSRETVIGEACQRFFCPARDGVCPITDLNETVNNEETCLVSTSGGRIPILKTAAPIFFDGRRLLLESFVDISPLKEAQADLKQAHDELERKVEERTLALRDSQAQLIQAEKLGALGTLTAGIAHELNNPLMGMLNFIQYCVKHTDSDDRRYAVLKDSERETRRCINIVRNLLTFSRMGGNGQEEFEKSSFAVLIERVLKLLSYRMEKENITIHTQIDEDVPDISIKTGEMQQVVLNIVGNALDAVKESSEKHIRIHLLQNAGKVELRVADSGAGIDRHALPRIFDPFFTTKPVGKGTGLGLSVSQSIVAAHGGDIWCQSRPAEGAVFTVRLPVSRAPD